MPSKKRFLLHWNSNTYHSPKAAFEALSGAFKWYGAPKGSSAFIKAIYAKLAGSDYQSYFSIVRDKTRRRKSRRPFFLMLKRLEEEFASRRKKKTVYEVIANEASARGIPLPHILTPPQAPSHRRTPADVLAQQVQMQQQINQQMNNELHQLWSSGRTYTFTTTGSTPAPVDNSMRIQAQGPHYWNEATQTLERAPSSGPQNDPQQNSTSRE